MKILVISNLYPPYVLGGYEMLCEDVCGTLSRRGHDIWVLTSRHGIDEDPGYCEQPRILRWLELYLPFSEAPRLMRGQRWRTSRRNYRLTQRAIEEIDPDVVFVWSQLRLTLGSVRAARAAGRPLVYVINDEHIGGYRPARFGLGPGDLARWLADALVFRDTTLHGMPLENATTNSWVVRDNLLAAGVPLDDCAVIYQGIRIEDFPVKSSPGRVRRPARVLYAGQLHDYKGVHTLVEAAATIGAQRGAGALELSIAGAGPEQYETRLRRAAESCAVPVHFLGKVPRSRLPAIYREHDVFVFPSIWQEPFGLTHLEAMASGTPVVSTNDGGHGEFLRHEDNALLFRKADARALARALLRLLDEPELGPTLARRARAMVEREFTMSRYTASLEAVLMRAKSA